MHRVQFETKDSEQLASFLLVLMKGGALFSVRSICGGWNVEITGV